MVSLRQVLVIIIILAMVNSCDSNEYKIKSSIYTRSCPEGEFVIQKLSFGMKIPRYQFLINKSSSLQKLLQRTFKSKWYNLKSTDFELDFPRISKQNSYMMVYKALQQYSASIHFLIKLTKRNLRRDLISIRNEVRKLMCSVEGLLNGLHAQEFEYEFIREKDMEIWLQNTLNTTLSNLVISKSLVKSLNEFNEIILDVANHRLNNLLKHRRKTKPEELIIS